MVATVLSGILPARLAAAFASRLPGEPMTEQTDPLLADTGAFLNNWVLTPSGTEGYAKAEVTRGGINTDYLSSRTMEAKNVPGLYFIGEAVDVTGWLGGTISSGPGRAGMRPDRQYRRFLTILSPTTADGPVQHINKQTDADQVSRHSTRIKGVPWTCMA